MNKLILMKIEHPEPEIIQYRYRVEGSWSYYFEPANELWVQYDRPVDSVGDSIAAVPFIGNFLVLAALQDAVICVDKIDSDFYNCVPRVIRGFQQAMPKSLHFKAKGLIQAEKIVENPLDPEKSEKDLLFYSGGVDAGSSFVSHWEERPTLLSVIGADVKCDNEAGGKIISERTHQAAASIGSDAAIICSNLRTVYQDDHINDYCYELVHDWWWPSFHHNVSMMCLAAPLANGHINKIYFAGTYCKKYERIKEPYILASNPLIDNEVRFCGCHVVHDGYEFSRLEKIDRICKFSQEKRMSYPLRVCYHSTEGDNCCRCEKCVRTIMALALLGYDPKEFGFSYDHRELPARFIDGMFEMSESDKFAMVAFYTDLQELLREKYSEEQILPELKLFYHCDLSELADFIRARAEVQTAAPDAVPGESLEYDQSLRVERDQLQAQYNAVKMQCDTIGEQKEALQSENEQLKAQIAELKNSHCWKMTKWIRILGDFFRK